MSNSTVINDAKHPREQAFDLVCRFYELAMVYREVVHIFVDYQAHVHHVGCYAYRPDALAAYTSWPVSQLEVLEGLEQLRFLVNDTKVRCVEVAGKGRVFWELNNPEDVDRINSVLKDL